MGRRLSWQLVLGLTLLALSALVYVIHYLIFRDLHHIMIYLIGDIAFVFIEVLMVTLIIHQVLTLREKRAIMEKLNMVVGAFFSEVGTNLLKIFSKLDPESAILREGLIFSAHTSASDFSVLKQRLDAHRYAVSAEPDALQQLQDLLVGKRDFMLRLLENPNLLEHEAFTDTLWGVFHLTDELSHRSDVHRLPKADYKHLANDITRAYKLLTAQWLAYMTHLRDNYPYLFSLAVRTNPFDPTASPEVVE
jgi:hypothetical protein